MQQETLTPFTDHTWMSSFLIIKSELHLHLKLTIWTGTLNGIYVPTVRMWLSPEWPFPSPQAGCTLRPCPHTAHAAPLCWANPLGPLIFYRQLHILNLKTLNFNSPILLFLSNFGSPVQFLTNDLPSPPGALYSRKFTIDGEQISLQVQDTPFVSLEVKQLLCAFQHTSVLCLLPALPSVINSAQQQENTWAQTQD